MSGPAGVLSDTVDEDGTRAGGAMERAAMIQIKRAYEGATADDGRRFLVERLWPRGVRKADLAIEAWLKDAAPTAELRKWYGHDPEKWPEFQKRYRAELGANADAWRPLLDAARGDDVTLVYAARDTERNSASVLRDVLTERLGG
jgi:uncharacterized protein YeaO (DUF488 family)